MFHKVKLFLGNILDDHWAKGASSLVIFIPNKGGGTNEGDLVSQLLSKNPVVDFILKTIANKIISTLVL